MRPGAGFHRVTGVHHLRQPGAGQRALSQRSVHSFCTIEQSILMPGVRVGRHAKIRRAIIDRDVLIPRGAIIGYNPDEDRRRHAVSDSGIVVVTLDDEPLIGQIRGKIDSSASRMQIGADNFSGHTPYSALRIPHCISHFISEFRTPNSERLLEVS